MNRIDKFLLLLSFIYLSAFSSLLIQSKGLFGHKGIVPARILISQDPSLFIRYLFGDTSSHSEDVNLLILLGVVISSLSFIFPKFRSKVSFLILWILYFSVYQIGQTFLWFQWDTLLLETGVIAIIIARHCIYGWSSDNAEADPSSLGFWLVKWLIFRLMFCSGVVKLLSECPTWWGLTALNWHYESQCIPTFLAWFAHQLPEWFQKFSVVSTFVIEIGISLLFFIPIKPVQLFSFYSQVLFQVCIILSGNYNFFNLLTITLCLSLLPREKSNNKSSRFSKTVKGQKYLSLQKYLHIFKTLIEVLISVAAIVIIFYKSVQYFGLKVNMKKKSLEMEINFSKRDFHEFLQNVVPVTIYVAIFSMFYEVFRLYTEIIVIKSWLKKIYHFISVTVISIIVIMIFSISLIPYSQIEPKTLAKLPHNIKGLYHSFNNYEIVNSYGLFRRMTGVGGRPEITIEGSNNVHGPWKEYEFLYKPGNLSRPPPFIIPHQPRLDWQMWFAALGSYQHNPWILNLLYRLLTNESSVIQLLDYNPFPRSPPHFVRVQQYTYSYTSFYENIKKHNWWERIHIAEYLPPISLGNQSFIHYLKENHIIFEEENFDGSLHKYYVKKLIDNLDQSMGHYFVWFIIGVNVVTKFSLLVF